MNVGRTVKIIAEIVFVVGASFSGKGYGFGEVMKGCFGAYHYETGLYCRSNLKEHANAGTLAPGEPILEDIKQAYLRHIATHGQKRFIIDSPRTVEQVKALVKMFKEMDPDCLISVVEINANEQKCRDNLADRLKRQQRMDDADEATVERRIKNYFGPDGILEVVIPFLKALLADTYYVINGMTSIDEMRAYS